MHQFIAANFMSYHIRVVPLKTFSHARFRWNMATSGDWRMIADGGLNMCIVQTYAPRHESI